MTPLEWNDAAHAYSSNRPAPVLTVAPVSQIGDGQIQGGMHTVTMAPVTQIGDGQIQNPAITTVPRAAVPGTASATPHDATGGGDEHPCGRPTGSSPSLGDLDVDLEATPALPSSTILTGNPRLPATRSPTPAPTTFSISTTTSQLPSSTVASTAPKLSLVSCLTQSTLQLTLSDNNLYDALNRTGYIASNYQFQFDGPPQSGALYTSGWSVCPVVSADPDADIGTPPAATTDSGLMALALGNSTTFWQCLSGEFYNLYTENWAGQCSPVEIRVVGLVDCDDDDAR
ncbi:uncharacterized protein A1O9_08375 [Exophiala aquamarina CBS 119918]|uniref:Cell wall mannoprotein PIR1-like C-terminal domain-containing protein n=1 Tax=Exophiala aquamarina CBS 119918 TaxID=1182545 RepID=A0A072PJB9_9EURO|nr:uncharacterized protein A1O9_08375 [Exophiala aquamarina CBS 119918]KEF55625.1 hypothetical protein A1O9_08375 [Exophiala aquamarina CBS 119918]